LQFLDGAISYIKKANDELPRSGSDVVEYAIIESYLMLQRLNLTTTLDEVEEHIPALERQYSRALEIRFEDVFRGKMYSSNLKTLGSAYFVRFRFSNDIADLNRAIALFQEHTELTSSISIHVGCNLGNALHRRFTIQKSPGDLDHAVEILQAAVGSLPSHMPDANAFKSLSSVLYSRAIEKQSLEDLEGAISNCELAIAALPDGSPERVRILDSVILIHMDRFFWGTQSATDFQRLSPAVKKPTWTSEIENSEIGQLKVESHASALLESNKTSLESLQNFEPLFSQAKKGFMERKRCGCLQNKAMLYTALPVHQREIRLVELLPGENRKIIGCHLLKVSLDTHPEYEVRLSSIVI
jgi:tetratricopeptide (TPR) repeat protein